jgi:hypothetical protein
MRLRSGGAYAAELPQAALLPHDVLVRIFGLLPRGVLAVTPGRVCRAWAAAKKEVWAAELAAAAALGDRAPDEKYRPYLPLWYVRGICSDAPHAAKFTMMIGACFHGLVDVFEELGAAASPEMYGTRPCVAAAAGGQLDMLVFLRERGFSLDGLTYEAAAEGDHLDVVMFLCEHGCPGAERACCAAASRGHLRILEVLHARGACPLTGLVLWHAVYRGQLEVVTWLRQRGCPWGHGTMGTAASAGNLQMVQLLRAQGCPLGEEACWNAVWHGHLEVLQFLVEQGCPIDVEGCLKVADKHPACRDWLKTLLPPPAAQ